MPVPVPTAQPQQAAAALEGNSEQRKAHDLTDMQMDDEDTIRVSRASSAYPPRAASLFQHSNTSIAHDTVTGADDTEDAGQENER